MNGKNNLLVLKQTEKGYSSSDKPLSGIVRIEEENGVSVLYLSPLNFSAALGGEYFACLLDGKKKLTEFTLGMRPVAANFTLASPPDLSYGFAFGIQYVKNGLPVHVAFAKTENFQSNITDFKKKVGELWLSKRKEILQTPKQPSKEELYDDEAVATENYYEADKKIPLLKETENERIGNEDVNADIGEQKIEREKPNDAFNAENETNFSSSEKFTEANPFYNSAIENLNGLFDKFPEDFSLKKVFPLSRWIKINYGTDKFYVVGEVFENDKVKYICYGVPSKYSETPPKELDGVCTFVPLSLFNAKGDGYWIMFQDAVTGDCVKQ